MLVVFVALLAGCSGSAVRDDRGASSAPVGASTPDPAASTSVPVPVSTSTVEEAPIGSAAERQADTEVARTEPSPTPTVEDVAPASNAPTRGVATIFTGTGRAGDPWAPVGWWDGSAWQSLSDLASPAAPTPEVSSVSITSLDLPAARDQVIVGLELGPGEPYCVNDELGPVIDFEPDVPDTPSSLGFDVIAVTADWPLQPRPVRRGDLDDEELARAALEFVPGVAEATDGQIAQVIVTDLDGDGLDETLVTVERQTDTAGAAGDFAVVMVRSQLPDGGVGDTALVAVEVADPATLEVPFPTAERHTIAAIADLNGDGVMEVVVRNRFFESAGVELYGYVAGAIEPLGLSGGCGV